MIQNKFDKALKPITKTPGRIYNSIRTPAHSHLYISFILLLFTIPNSFAQAPAYTATVNGNVPGGYYFVEPLVFGSYPHSSYNMILDSAGNVVYYNHLPSPCYGFTIQPNGLMSYFNTYVSDFLLMDSTFTVIDTVRPKNGYNSDVHEMEILPNGDYLMLVQEIVSMDLSSYYVFNGDSLEGSADADVICGVIQEQDTNKNVVFEWHAKDYLPFNSVDPFFLSDPNTVDWTHCNALQVDTDGNILLSSRNLDEITKINKLTGAVMWRFGGNYNQFTYIGDSTHFYGQHDIRRINNGHYTLFDDGDHYKPHGARACEYKLNTTNMTAQLAWSYTYDSTMSSGSLGSVQRLPSGATVIDYGGIQSNNICFNVVDSAGAQLFNVTFGDVLTSYRAFNYPTLPWKLNRPQVTCFESHDTLFLDAGSGYASYQWSTGDTSEIIAVTSPGTFYVFVPYGQGGFISSETKIITNLNNYCGATSVPEAQLDNSVKIFPNPAHNQINIYSKSLNGNIAPTIKDLSGRILYLQQLGHDLSNYTFTYDTSSLADGFYFLTINGQSFKFIKN